MKNYSKSQGFTLIELMLVIAVAGILLAVAIPSFRTLIMNNRMTSTANEVLGAISFARMEAVKRGGPVGLGQYNSSWASGIVVWADTDGDGTQDTGEEIVRLWPALHGGSTLGSTGSKVSFVFNAMGRANSGDTLTLCDNRTGETGREITLLTSGAVSIKRVTCA